MANRRKKRSPLRGVSSGRKSLSNSAADEFNRFLRRINMSRSQIMEHRMLSTIYLLLGIKVFLTGMVFRLGIYSYLVGELGFLLFLNGIIHIEILRPCRHPKAEIVVNAALYMSLHVVWLLKDFRRFYYFLIIGIILGVIGTVTPLFDPVEEEKKKKHWIRRHKVQMENECRRDG